MEKKELQMSIQNDLCTKNDLVDLNSKKFEKKFYSEDFKKIGCLNTIHTNTCCNI